MPLKLRPHPHDLLGLVSHALAHLSPPQPPSFSAVCEPHAGPLEPALPHPIYTLSWDALVAGKGLNAATHTGWRTIVLKGEQVWAAVECGADVAVDSAVVNRGPFVAATLDAIAAAEASPDVSGEVRLLEVPSVYTVAVWVYRKVGSHLFILAPAPRPFEPLVAVSEADFMTRVTSVAIERLRACDNTPRPPPRIEQSVDAWGNKTLRFLPPSKEGVVARTRVGPGRRLSKHKVSKGGRPAALKGRS